MSRIGKLPIVIPQEVDVKVDKTKISVKGPKGKLAREMHPNMKMETVNGSIVTSRPNDLKLNKSLHGLTRTLINNMIIGVTKGFQKKLQILGVGYRAMVDAKKLTLYLGYTKPVEYPIPEGIKLAVSKNNEITVEGIEKEKVGQVAAEIRGFKPPEPYKGKGIRYVDERVVKKAGKAAATSKA